MMGAGALIMIPALVMLLFAVAAALMHAGVSVPVAGGAPISSCFDRKLNATC